MRTLLAVALLLSACAAAPGATAVTTGGTPPTEHVTIPDGAVALQAVLARPAGAPKAPSIVALHGCGGPWPQRDRQWEDILTADGHVALFPDSFGSRGLGSQCKVEHRTVSPSRQRRGDALAAADWLAARPETPPGGIVLMGWSNGGSTVLATAGGPPGPYRGFVALYPGCRGFTRQPSWHPSAPVLILMGETDDWTPAAPCHELAARFPTLITLVTYPDTYHDFDVPGHPVRARSGLAYTAGGGGQAHTGTNENSRADAISRVLAFLNHAPSTP